VICGATSVSLSGESLIEEPMHAELYAIPGLLENNTPEKGVRYWQSTCWGWVVA
jgi:hypothetical protein